MSSSALIYRQVLLKFTVPVAILLAVVLVAVRFGRGPAVLASILSVAAFDWFTVPPYNTFRVEEGLLKVRYDNWTGWDGQFGHLFHERPFTHYIVAAEYRFVGSQVTGAGHFSHRILFAPDGTMFVTSGDRQKMEPAQDRGSDLGKIIHMTDEGQRIGGAGKPGVASTSGKRIAVHQKRAGYNYIVLN